MFVRLGKMRSIKKIIPRVAHLSNTIPNLSKPSNHSKNIPFCEALSERMVDDVWKYNFDFLSCRLDLVLRCLVVKSNQFFIALIANCLRALSVQTTKF